MNDVVGLAHGVQCHLLEGYLNFIKERKRWKEMTKMEEKREKVLGSIRPLNSKSQKRTLCKTESMIATDIIVEKLLLIMKCRGK